jgi:hypothetical protein
MNVYESGPIHDRAKWKKPTAYRTSVGEPPRFPRLVVLRSSCGHVLGVGYVWRHQGYIAWKSCP